MTETADMTDLVERLRERITRLGASTPDAMLNFMSGIFPLLQQAATALEAKDKELEALRGLLDEWEDRTGPQLMDRAETAERGLNSLIDYIKSWTSPATMRLQAGEMSAQEVRTVQAILSAVLDHARAARAITGEKP